MAARVSQKLIAQMAGVDQSTVSNVLRGHSAVAPATRKKVLRVCQAMRYTPNAHARGLRTSQSRLVGMVTASVGQAYHAMLVDTLLRTLAGQGRHLLLRHVDLQDDVGRQREQIRGLMDRQADGVLVATTDARLRVELRQVFRQGVPLVMMGSSCGELPFVSCHRHDAAAHAARHLASQGCRRLAALLHAAPMVDAMQDKAAGFAAGAAQAGLAAPILHLTLDVARRDMVQAGHELGVRLLASHPEVDGVFCETDEVAVGLLSAMQAAGRRVPQDVAIVGFDDLSLASHAAVPLTSVRQPVEALALASLEMLDALCEGRSPRRRHVVPFELVLRASTRRRG